MGQPLGQPLRGGQGAQPNSLGLCGAAAWRRMARARAMAPFVSSGPPPPEKVALCSMPDEIRLRPLASADEPFLRELIWLAAHWSADPPPPPGELGLELERYVVGFGRPGDRGVLSARLLGCLGGEVARIPGMVCDRACPSGEFIRSWDLFQAWNPVAWVTSSA
jgi:hypothetical protein